MLEQDMNELEKLEMSEKILLSNPHARTPKRTLSATQTHKHHTRRRRVSMRSAMPLFGQNMLVPRLIISTAHDTQHAQGWTGGLNGAVWDCRWEISRFMRMWYCWGFADGGSRGSRGCVIARGGKEGRRAGKQQCKAEQQGTQGKEREK